MYIHIHQTKRRNEVEVYVYTYTHTCIYLHTHIHIFSYIHIYIHIFLCVYIHAYIYTYIYIRLKEKISYRFFSVEVKHTVVVLSHIHTTLAIIAVVHPINHPRIHIFYIRALQDTHERAPSTHMEIPVPAKIAMFNPVDEIYCNSATHSNTQQHTAKLIMRHTTPSC